MKQMKKMLVLTTLLTIVSSIVICVYATTTPTQSEASDVYTCDRCNGSRIDPQYTRDCGHCNGGVISILRDCLECYGTGKVKDQYGNERTCPKCDGAKKYFDNFSSNLSLYVDLNKSFSSLIYGITTSYTMSLTVFESLVKYTAAKKDSNISATIDSLVLPPVSSSPFPSLR